MAFYPIDSRNESKAASSISRTRQAGPSRGMDHQTWCGGRSEGHACRARWIAMDNQTKGIGPDKQVPLSVGAARLSRPLKHNGWPNELRRTRQAGRPTSWRGALVTSAEAE